MSESKLELEALFDGLGDEIWRQYVDLDSQEFGPLAYDRGLGKGAREPGYLDSLARGHALARRHLGRSLTTEFYQALHCATLAHAPPRGSYRSAAAWVHVRRSRLDPGVEQVWREHGAAPDPKAPGVSPDKIRLRFEKVEPAVMRRHVGEAIDGLYERLRVASGAAERLLAVATFHQTLELLHPTRDGNTRRHAILLDKLLVDQGLTPVIMTEINDVYVGLPANWARMVAQGMHRWRLVWAAVAHGEDVVQRMRDLDARGTIGQSGGRRLRASRMDFESWEHVAFDRE